MNNQQDEAPIETEGPPLIVPSARPSIHQHNHKFSKPENMTRYGLIDKEDEKASSNHDQGIDEVDNVMSKFSRQSSPMPVRQKKNKTKARRNSLSVSNQECTDDDDSDGDLLAKSLPANLPSYYCSDDFAHQSLPSDFFKTHNSTSISEKSMRTEIHRNELYSYRTSLDTQSENYGNKQSTPQGSKSCSYMLLLIGMVCVIVAVYFNYITEVFQGKNSIQNYGQIDFRKDMSYLGEKYKINDNSILEVQSGISTILERNDTGSFIFVYNAKSVDFDFVQFSNIVKDIAATAARYLRNDSTAMQPTVIHSSKLNMETHSELMNEYRREVAKTGVMLVIDVDNVPPSLAMAFHYFCDEYNPLVAKSAIFFTLNLEKCSNKSEHNMCTHREIEKCLEQKWRSVPKDSIKPLLARVVNVVIDLTSV